MIGTQLLFIGLRAPQQIAEGSLHIPFIRVEPITEAIEARRIQRLCGAYKTYTHMLFTSQTAVHFFLKQFTALPEALPPIYSVGKATARYLQERGFVVAHTAHEETAEGVVKLLQELLPKTVPKDAHLFWPHSAEARAVLHDYLAKASFRSTTCSIYRTIQQRPEPLPDLRLFDGVVFTSPSTVHSFMACYGVVSDRLTYFAIGPITAQALEGYGCKSVPWKRGDFNL